MSRYCWLIDSIGWPSKGQRNLVFERLLHIAFRSRSLIEVVFCERRFYRKSELFSDGAIGSGLAERNQIGTLDAHDGHFCKCWAELDNLLK